MSSLDDDEYEIPLRDQRYFGAGIKRKRVQFVPSSSHTPSIASLPLAPGPSVSETYLSIVLGSRKADEDAATRRSSSNTVGPPWEATDANDPVAPVTLGAPLVGNEELCTICLRPMTAMDASLAHERTISHQICLQHSHPPSHIDRRRKGLAILEGQGWDPDSRKGLGEEENGLLFPIKAKGSLGGAGIGLKAKDLQFKQREKPVKLDAGKIKMLEKVQKKKAQKLRDAFYRSDDVEKYLGAEGKG